MSAEPKTRDLAQFTILADILVVAAGHPNLIVPQMVRSGAVVVPIRWRMSGIVAFLSMWLS